MSLPIVKTISFSALSNWEYCTWYYYLKNILKIPVDETNKVYTHWGTHVHRYLQAVLGGEDPVKCAARFTKVWIRFCRMYGKYIEKQIDYEKKGHPLTWGINAVAAIGNAKQIFEKQFGKFKVLQIEERLALPAAEKYPQTFKGFIDVVLELENGDIVIIDIKTCHSAYLFNKYLIRDKHKSYQLTLYKFFYHLKNPDIKLQNIETYFAPLARSKSKEPLTFTRVTSGPKKIENALEWLQRALRSINKEVFIKNRFACHKYNNYMDDRNLCDYYDTEHCPK